VLSLVANIVIVPFSEIIIIFSLLMTIVLGINLQMDWLNIFYDEVIHILLRCIHFFSQFDWAMLENIPLFLVEVMTLYLALYLLRDVVIKKNFRQFLRLSFTIVLFFSLRLGLNWVYLLKVENIEMQNRNKKVVFHKRKNRVICYVDEKINPDDLKKYILNPYLSSRRISEYKIIYIK
jgi:competence protein ComEC